MLVVLLRSLKRHPTTGNGALVNQPGESGRLTNGLFAGFFVPVQPGLIVELAAADTAQVNGVRLLNSAVTS